MKKIFIALVIFSLAVVYTAGTVNAAGTASLLLDKTTYTVATGSTFTVDVSVDPGTDSISSTDAHVTFDSTVLEAESVAPGTYFPSVNQTITAGKVSIFASVTDPASSKTGKGVIATITFKGLKAGTSNVTFYCDTTAYNTSKVIKNDVDATNIIDCTANSSATVTVGGGGGGSPLTTPTPVTSLPQSGAAADLSMYAVMGMGLIVLGGIVKLKIAKS
jgi:hypothetical protein